MVADELHPGSTPRLHRASAGRVPKRIASSPAFRFRVLRGWRPSAPRRRIAWDGDRAVRAPYDNCVLVMPVPNNVKTGLTAVRLGRLETR